MNYKRLFVDADLKDYSKIIKYLTKGLKVVGKFAGDGPVYPAFNKNTMVDLINDSSIPQKGKEFDTILDDVYKEFGGCVKTGHPMCMKNILPQSNLAGLIGLLLGNLYMANGVTGEDAGQLLDCELKCSSALAEYVGYDKGSSAGIFTYGGSGTNLYAMKVGLLKANRESLIKGNINNTFVVGSASAHYCHLVAVNWLGIGEENYVQIPVNTDQTTNLQQMKEEIENIISNGGKIAAIMLSGGTTSNMAIDDVYEMFNFRNAMVEKYKLDYSPHIHCDSVIGWAYCCFKDYDMVKNINKFSKATLNQIAILQEKTKKFKYADSLGIDFHKTGYVQYVSSMVLFKDKNDFNLLKKKKERLTPLFHDDLSYNPGIFTLETTRSTATMLSTWLTLNAIGVEGYQYLLGKAMDCANYLRKLIQSEDNGLYVVNKTFYGSDVFIGVKEFGKQDPNLNLETDGLNKQTSDFARYIMSIENCEYAISKSSAAIYNDDQKPIQGIRVYLLASSVSKNMVKKFYNMIKRDRLNYEEIKKTVN